jgi:C1A family cysteine protease
MNLAKIESHNADKTQTHTLGVTQFSDLTQDEFVKIYLNTRVNHKFTDEVHGRTAASTPQVGDVDWVSNGKVSKVKNQGNCGSCWAFSANAAIESAYLIAGQDLDLSEQQLVDCSRAYGNQGCSGGWMDSAFQYVIDHGIASTS